MSEQTKFQTSHIAARTRELMIKRSRDITHATIQAETGLTESWLTTFINKPEADFSINRVECLYTFLTGKKPTL